MRINIITSLNGVGLERDAYILRDALQGHEVNIVNLLKPRIKRADVNIFCEIIKPNFLKLATKNYFIPNPEWYVMGWDRYLDKVEVLNKTRYSQREFGGEYIGFTSLDFWNGGNKVRRFAHYSGKSSYKGTEYIFQAWKPEYPTLYVKRDRNPMNVQLPNVEYQYKRLPEDEFKANFAESQIHLCPSIAEGWGHYIWEAMSAGNVVITTDGAPMNEYISDDRLLVKTEGSERLNRGIKYTPSPKDLQRCIDNVMGMSDKELTEIGEQNRETYLENDKQFKQRISDLFS